MFISNFLTCIIDVIFWHGFTCSNNLFIMVEIFFFYTVLCLSYSNIYAKIVLTYTNDMYLYQYYTGVNLQNKFDCKVENWANVFIEGVKGEQFALSR